MPVEEDSDRQLRAMVALIEGQAEQLAALRRAVMDLTGRLAIRSDLDVLVASQVDAPVAELNVLLDAIGDASSEHRRIKALVDDAKVQAVLLGDVASDLIGPQGWGGAPVGRARVHRVTMTSVVERAFHLAGLGARLTRVSTAIEPQLCLVTSPPRLVAILVNLLDRATRLSPEGGVNLRAWTAPPGSVRMAISDSGPGLGGDDPERAFAAFDPDGGDDGVGDSRALSLYLVRLLARSLGGEARLSEGAEGGTVVTIDLPQRRGGE
jgi:signal transduction histidine kinase